MNADNENEIVATGDLFKQANTGSKTWALRKFVLSGPFLIYFTHDGLVRKGQFDITDCNVKNVSAEECGSKNAKYAFSVIGPKKSLLLCASSERNRVAWMILISQQAEEYADTIRRYLKSGEALHANVVIKKKGTLGMSSKIRVLVTNFPRILLLDPNSFRILDQMAWNRAEPPTLIVVSLSFINLLH
jgi:PH domain